MLGSILAFLKFNISKGKQIFMGNVGSLLEGFILAVFSTMILSTEFSNTNFISNKPVYILSLAFASLDTIRVINTRVISVHF